MHDLALKQSTCLSLKRVLISARTELQEACTLAERIGDKALTARLRQNADLLANELAHVDDIIAELE